MSLRPKPLVSKLVDVLGVELIARRVDVPDGFEKTQRKESVNSGEHEPRYPSGTRAKAKLAAVGDPSRRSLMASRAR